jgi:pimeloyl-ACP methyl ester carboxylesterase
VLLHGGPGGNDYLDSILPELDGFDVIRYQQRSVPPAPVDGPYTIEQHVADLAALLDRLRLDHVWLLGHSWGGHLALHALTAMPERFAAALIIDPLGPLPEEPGAFERMLKRDLEVAQLARLEELDALERAGELSDEQAIESVTIVWPNYHHDRGSPPPMPPMQFSVAGYTGAMDSLVGHFEAGTLAERLPDVEVPTVFVHGGSSPLDVEHSRAGRRLMPAAELVIVEAAGHFPWLEQPGCVRRSIERLRLRVPLSSLPL